MLSLFRSLGHDIYNVDVSADIFQSGPSFGYLAPCRVVPCANVLGTFLGNQIGSPKHRTLIVHVYRDECEYLYKFS